MDYMTKEAYWGDKFIHTAGRTLGRHKLDPKALFNRLKDSAWSTIGIREMGERGKPLKLPEGLRRGENLPAEVRKFNEFTRKATDSIPLIDQLRYVMPGWTGLHSDKPGEMIRANVKKQIEDAGWLGAQGKADWLQHIQKLYRESDPDTVKSLPKLEGIGDSGTFAQQYLLGDKDFQSVGDLAAKHTPQGWLRANKSWLIPALFGGGGLALLAWMLMSGGGSKATAKPSTVNNYYGSPSGRQAWNRADNWTGYNQTGGRGYR